ncbi:MAG: hypothetical protein NPIRA02_02600 [Nitrospirales bacterium]|nr:MAG: hypothetical protein NPIRA02_02600 [Nitrospirales bacterium]
MKTLIIILMVSLAVCCGVVSATATTVGPDQLIAPHGKKAAQTHSSVHRISQRGCTTIPDRYRQEEYGDVLHALEGPCPRTFSEKEQLFIAGLSQKLLQDCGLPTGLQSRRRLQKFLSSSRMVALIGSQYGNPNLQKGWRDQAISTTVYGVGALFGQSIGCGNRARLLTHRIMEYLTRTAGGNGKGSRYVKGCMSYYANRYSNRQCQCLADLGRAIMPNIHQSKFDRSSIQVLIKRNPLIGLQIAVQCGIGNY